MSPPDAAGRPPTPADFGLSDEQCAQEAKAYPNPLPGDGFAAIVGWWLLCFVVVVGVCTLGFLLRYGSDTASRWKNGAGTVGPLSFSGSVLLAYATRRTRSRVFGALLAGDIDARRERRSAYMAFFSAKYWFAYNEQERACEDDARRRAKEWRETHASQEAHGASRVAEPRDDIARERALAVLGLDAAGDLETVQRAYRRKVNLLHPDKFADHPDEMRAEAAESFRRVQEAFERLTRELDR